MELSSHRIKQRSLLLQAAYELVAEVGIDGLRTRDIAKKANLNLAIFHYCFGSKDDLLRALYQYIVSRFRTESERFVQSDQSSKERLAGLFKLRVFATQHMARDLKVWRTFQGLADTNEAVREILLEHFSAQRKRIAEILQTGIEQGEFRFMTSATVEINAAIIVSLQNGLTLQLGVDPEAFKAEDYAAAVLGTIFTDKSGTEYLIESYGNR